MNQPVQLSWCDRSKQVLSSLLDAEVSAMVSACTGKGSEDVIILAKARSLLKKARDGQLWFACGCNSDELALLHPRLINGSFSLVRNAHSPHASDCVFVPKDKEPTPLIAADPIPTGYKPHAVFTGQWLSGSPLEASVTPRKESSLDKPVATVASNKALDGLTRRLYAGIEYLQLNQICSTDLFKANDRWLVKGKDKSCLSNLDSMPMGYDLTWKDVGCASLGDLAGLRKQLPAIRPRFGGRALEGFFFGPLTAIDLHEKNDGVLIYTVNKYDFTVAVQGRIALSGFARGGVHPYLALARLREAKGLTYIPVVGASAVLVHSPYIWMPVESDLERKTLDTILSVLRWYCHRTEGTPVQPVTVFKPLFDMMSDDPEKACRPDFIVSLPNGKKVVVESMGMEDDANYLERKSRSHPKMLAIENVLSIMEFSPNSEPRLFCEQLQSLILKNTA